MGKYLLIKEQIHTDRADKKKDTSLIGGVSFDDYDDAIKEGNKYLHYPEDIIYVVGVVARCFGDAKIEKEDCGNIPTKSCDECGCPEHEGRCGPESIQK